MKLKPPFKTEIPGNLNFEISQRQERVAKRPEQILYNTGHLPETRSMYFEDTHMYKFEAEVLEIFANVLDKENKGKRNIVILD